MTDTTKTARRIVPLLASAALLLLPAAGLAAGNAHGEIATAAEHAGFASKSGTVAMVHTHLHHTLNCLVGPKGKAFDTSALNPCAGSGNGAIPDTADAKTKAKLEAAAAEAEKGLKDSGLTSAQAIAAKVEAMLKAAE